jgi:prepilin-type N-terminal cleavage/methylation domain-containing protein
MNSRKAKRGFTLAEMLVTVSIIAVLAAVVVPSVAGSLFKGDAGRVTSDLTNIRGGIEQFLSDVRRYPGRIADLTTLITATNTDINSTTVGVPATNTYGVAYTQAVINRWRGPYVNNAPTTTGFGGTVGPSFMRVDCAAGANSSTPTTTAITGTPCLAVVVTGITPTEARRVDFAMDDSVNTTGLVRFKLSGTDSLFYLVTPIQ